MSDAPPSRWAALLLAAAAAACAGGESPDRMRLQDPTTIPATAVAAPAAAPPAGPASGRCTFDVRDQPIERVLEYVRYAAGEGVPITAAPEFAGVRITMKIQDVPWRNALRAIAGQAGCRVVEADGGFTLARLP